LNYESLLSHTHTHTQAFRSNQIIDCYLHTLNSYHSIVTYDLISHSAILQVNMNNDIHASALENINEFYQLSDKWINKVKCTMLLKKTEL